VHAAVAIRWGGLYVAGAERLSRPDAQYQEHAGETIASKAMIAMSTQRNQRRLGKP